MESHAWIVWLVIGGLLLVAFLLSLASTWNRAQRMRQDVLKLRANLSAALTKRADLANRLIDIAANYADHEKVAHLRASANMALGGAVSGDFSSTMSRMNVIAAQYPNLKANETWQSLSQQLTTLETELQQRRETLNGAINTYNVARTTFPRNVVYSWFGFEEMSYLDAAAPAYNKVDRADGDMAQFAVGAVPYIPVRAPAEPRALPAASPDLSRERSPGRPEAHAPNSVYLNTWRCNTCGQLNVLSSQSCVSCRAAVPSA